MVFEILFPLRVSASGSSPCQNGGYCAAGTILQWVAANGDAGTSCDCICAEGYSGDLCEIARGKSFLWKWIHSLTSQK